MHILMVILGESLLNDVSGDSLERHIRYARSIGRLSIITYAPRYSGSPPREINSHLKIIISPARTRFGFLISAYRIGLEIARESMPDMISTLDPFGTGLIGLMLKRKLKVLLEVQNHSDYIDNHHWISEHPFVFPVLNALGKWIVPRADFLRVVNRVEGEKYKRLGVPSARIRMLPVPVNLEKFSQNISLRELRVLDSRWNLRGDKKILLWVGRAVWFKRIPILLQAYEKLLQNRKDLQLLIVGDGPELPLWKIWARRLNIDQWVTFTGMVAHSELPLYFARCNLFIHPSIYEGFGRTIVEAAASGTPVVVTKTAGADEIVVDGKSGLLAEQENPNDLAEKMATVLDNPRLSERMGRAAQERVSEKFDSEKAFNDIIQAWTEISKENT